MKKLLALVVGAILLLSLIGCGAKSDNQKSQDTPVAKNTLEGIINDIQKDFTTTSANLTEELHKLEKSVNTYESYEKNYDKILAWYTLVENESEKLYERTKESSIEYYKLIASTIDNDDYDALEDALEDFYEAIYEDAFDDYYEAIYEDAFDEIYETYYDGVLDEAEDSIDYEAWYDAVSEFYDDWSDAASDFYDDWGDVMEEFYDNNFDVDDIIGKKSIDNEQSEDALTVEEKEESEKLVIELKAGEEGEYGTTVVFNEGTDDEIEEIVYHIPAGEYTATNIGECMDQFNIYSDETKKTEEGWEEPAETIFVELVDVGKSVEFSIEDGQYIKIATPGIFKIEQR